MSMEGNKKKPSVFELLQPELLTVEELTDILHTCCVSKNIKNCGKDELVEIFNRIALPLPQRTYKNDTWRERMLAKKQGRKKIQIDSLPSTSFRTIKPSESSRKPPVTSNANKTSDIETSPNNSNNTRIKPPVDLINFQRKVIKLNASSPPGKKSDDLNRIVIKDKSKDICKLPEQTSSTEDKKESDGENLQEEETKLNGNKHKKIKIDFSDSSEKSTPTPKLIRIKRTTNAEEPNEPVRKHKRVVI